MSSLEVVILCFNSTNASCVEPPTNKQHKNYNFVQKLQDSWATQFAWVEFKIGDGILVFVKCIVCGVITCQAIHIMFKRDNLGKHMGKQKMSHDILARGWRKMKFITARTTNMLWNLALFNVGWLLFILQKVGSVMLRRINVKLTSSSVFSMFYKTIDPYLNINIWNLCSNFFVKTFF